MELGYDLDELVVMPELYGASPATMLAIVGALDDALESAMLVAHDPGMSELAAGLSADIDRMPTCAVAEFTFDVASWRRRPRRLAGHRPVRLPAPRLTGAAPIGGGPH